MTAELLREKYQIQGRNFDKAGEISSEIKVILKDLELDAGCIRRVVIVAFEAEMNVVMYADRGTLTLILTDRDITLEVVDEGPGIPDIDLAMKDGFTTGNGLGLGLGGAKRLVNEFDIQSKPGSGTRVTVTRWKLS